MKSSSSTGRCLAALLVLATIAASAAQLTEASRPTAAARNEDADMLEAFADTAAGRGIIGGDDCEWEDFKTCWTKCWYCPGERCYDWWGEERCYGTKCWGARKCNWMVDSHGLGPGRYCPPRHRHAFGTLVS